MNKRKSNSSVLPQSSKLYSVEIEGDKFEVIISDDDNSPVLVSNGSKSHEFQVESNSLPKNVLVSGSDDHLSILIEKSDFDLNVHLGCRQMKAVVKTERDLLLDKYRSISYDDTIQNHIESPLPGLITKIQVKTGAQIKKGESIVIIEAMKMENEIRAPHNCTVKQINVKEGQAIDKGHIVAHIE